MTSQPPGRPLRESRQQPCCNPSLQNCGACNDDRWCASGPRRCRRILAAIDFDHEAQAALNRHRARAQNLGTHFGKKLWPPNPSIADYIRSSS